MTNNPEEAYFEADEFGYSAKAIQIGLARWREWASQDATRMESFNEFTKRRSQFRYIRGTQAELDVIDWSYGGLPMLWVKGKYDEKYSDFEFKPDFLSLLIRLINQGDVRVFIESTHIPDWYEEEKEDDVTGC